MSTTAPPPYNPAATQSHTHYATQSHTRYDPVDQHDVEKGYGAAPATATDLMYGIPASEGGITIKHAFLRKVYTVLSLQLLVTAGICALAMFSSGVRNAVLESSRALFWVLLIGMIVVLVALFYLKKRHPHNIILLGVFTLLMSWLVASVAASSDTVIVLQAFLITATITLSLTLYTFYTKRDFSFMGGGLMAALMGLILFGIIQIFWPNPVLHFLVALAGVIVFSLLIVYDTYLLLHKTHPDDWVVACVSLYLDIINLFLYALALLDTRSS